MATLKTEPQVVDVSGYAGDTLSLSITIPTAFIAGRVLSAQIRASSGATSVDATFVVTVPTITDGPAILTLPASETARLVAGTTVINGVYSGVWDCQLAPVGGGDPTTTVVRGSLVLTRDVTRLP